MQKTKSLFPTKQASLRSNIFMLIILTTINISTTFLENSVIAAYFGLSIMLDAFLAAKALPDFFASLIGAAEHANLIPRATKTGLQAGNTEYQAFVTTFLFGGVLAFLPLGIIGALVSPYLVQNVLTFEAEAKNIAIVTLQTMFLILPLMIFLFTGRGVLEIGNNFWAGSLPGILRSLLAIGLAITFAYLFGPFVLLYAILISSVLGAILFVVLLARRDLFLGMNWSWFKWSPIVIRTIFAALPASLILSVYQFYPLIDRLMISTLDVGAVSGLFFAFQIVLIPHTLINSSASAVLFPTLARQHLANNEQEVSRIMTRGLRTLALLGIIGSVFLILFRMFIVSIIFERGNFNVDDTVFTSNILLFYGIGFWALGPISILTRMLLAMQNHILLFFLGLGAVIAKITLNFLLLRWDALGFALATSLTGILLVLVEILILSYLLPHTIRWKAYKDLFGFAMAILGFLFLYENVFGQVLASNATSLFSKMLEAGIHMGAVGSFIVLLMILFRLPEWVMLKRLPGWLWRKTRSLVN